MSTPARRAKPAGRKPRKAGQVHEVTIKVRCDAVQVGDHSPDGDILVMSAALQFLSDVLADKLLARSGFVRVAGGRRG